jgi:hypothetical protein
MHTYNIFTINRSTKNPFHQFNYEMQTLYLATITIYQFTIRNSSFILNKRSTSASFCNRNNKFQYKQNKKTYKFQFKLSQIKYKQMLTSIFDLRSIIWCRSCGCCNKRMTLEYVWLSLIKNSISWTMNLTTLFKITWFFCNKIIDHNTTLLSLKNMSQLA